MSYSYIVCEFSVNEPTKHIREGIFKEERTWNKVMYWSVDQNVVTRGLKETNS